MWIDGVYLKKTSIAPWLVSSWLSASLIRLTMAVVGHCRAAKYAAIRSSVSWLRSWNTCSIGNCCILLQGNLRVAETAASRTSIGLLLLCKIEQFLSRSYNNACQHPLRHPPKHNLQKWPVISLTFLSSSPPLTSFRFSSPSAFHGLLTLYTWISKHHKSSLYQNVHTLCRDILN